MDDSLFFSMPTDIQPTQGTHHSGDANVVCSWKEMQFVLCYECGEVVSSKNFQHHILVHEVVSVAYQLYHSEELERRGAEIAQQRIKEKQRELELKRQREFQVLSNNVVKNNLPTANAYVEVPEAKTFDELVEQLRANYRTARKAQCLRQAATHKRLPNDENVRFENTGRFGR